MESAIVTVQLVADDKICSRPRPVSKSAKIDDIRQGNKIIDIIKLFSLTYKHCNHILVWVYTCIGSFSVMLVDVGECAFCLGYSL